MLHSVFCIFLRVKLNIVWIWLKQQDDKVDQYTDAEKPRSKEVQNTHANFSLIEFVTTDKTQEDAEQKCDPFIFLAASATCIYVVCVRIGVDIVVVDDDLRLCIVCTFVDIFHLSAA